MIIACPYCHTRYQVANGVIGSAGRKVQCAHCHRSWQARAELDLPVPARPAPKPPAPTDTAPVDVVQERQMDDAFEQVERKTAEEKVVAFPERPALSPTSERPADATDMATGPGEAALPQPPHDEALIHKKLRALAKREEDLWRKLPAARLRRLARILSSVALVALIASGLTFRTGIVRFAPSLAPVYAAIGLPVNVVGLDFRDVKTLRTLVDGSEKLIISATIYSVDAQPVPVPPVVVTLLDGTGAPIYQWSVAPQVRIVAPGESYEFETRLPAPPKTATGIRLTFGPRGAAGGGPGSQNAAATPVAAHIGAH